MQSQSLTLTVVVKATPLLTSHLEETMCVAGILSGPEPRWVRLHPVPFRDLDSERRFRKYQEITVDVIPPVSDRRPESLRPIPHTIRLGRSLATEKHWSERRVLVSRMPELAMCELVRLNVGGSGPTSPSLAVMRPASPPELEITEREPDQLKRWRELAAAKAAQPSLFDARGKPPLPLEIVPWRFRYRYRCSGASCSGHSQTIVDWEVAAFWRKVRRKSDWQDRMRRRFVDDLWSDKRDTVMFVGNQEQHPGAFLVLGIFWPPKAPLQPKLTD